MNTDDSRHDYGTQAEAPASREYVHDRCGGRTKLLEMDYPDYCDPFAWLTKAYCIHCGASVPLTDVRWADTGETLAECRRRLRELTPRPLRRWRTWLGQFLGAVGGFALWFPLSVLLLPSDWVVSGTTVAGILSAIAFRDVGARLLNRKYGIDYRRR